MTAPDPVFFRDLALIFIAAVAGGALAHLARQPLILGYVAGGLLVSPFTPGPSVAGHLHTFELFAEIGVILLMFSIGLEFSLRDLLRVRTVALVAGPLGIVGSIGLGLGVGALLGWTPRQGAVVGAVVSVASTMVLVRLLADRGEIHTVHGRVMIGVTLVEDLAVVVMLVLLPTFGSMESGRLLALAAGLGKAALILVPFAVLAHRVMPKLLARVARTRSEELFLLVALAIGLGTAALTQEVGLSLALGAFLAGLIVSESEFAHETLARVLSLRDAFVALFFVTMGTLIDPGALLGNLPLLLGVVGLILVGKPILRTVLVRALGYPLRTAILVGVGLAQIGEFSFVLVGAARAANLVGPDAYQATLAASLVTILANAAMVRLAPRLVARLAPASAPPETATPRAAEPSVVLVGFGRVGSAIGDALDTFGVPYVPIDRDPDVVRALRARGIAAVYGDASQSEILRAAGAEQARLVVVAVPDGDRAWLAIRHARALSPAGAVLVRAHSRRDEEAFRAGGATVVVQPEVEAAATLIRHALVRLDLPADRLTAYLDRYRDAMSPGTRILPGSAPGLPEVREAPLPDGSLVGQSLRDARIRERSGVTVVALLRGDGTVVANPSADTVLHAEDRLRVFGRPDQIDAFLAGADRREADPGVRT